MRPDELPTECGVYRFTHRVTGDTYIGSAANMRERGKTHMQKWRTPIKCPQVLCELIIRNGADFDAEVLALTTYTDRLREEARLIAVCRPTLNSATFRDDKPVRDGRPVAEQINFRLATDTCLRMESFRDRHHLHPTLTQIVEAAVSDWLDVHEPELPDANPPKKPTK